MYHLTMEKNHDTNAGAASTQQQETEEDEYFMRLALKVAQRALEVGEVPVGCVIVMPVEVQNNDPSETTTCIIEDDTSTMFEIQQEQQERQEQELQQNTGESDSNNCGQSSSLDRRSGRHDRLVQKVVVSHGANQVNATRDATRHAELVAMDRMLTGGQSSDALCLPVEVIAKLARANMLPPTSPLLQYQQGHLEPLQKHMYDKWMDIWEPFMVDRNQPHATISKAGQTTNHNSSNNQTKDDGDDGNKQVRVDSKIQQMYGWRSGRIHNVSDLKQCTLYGRSL